ncbi:hypothetical protein NPIL_315941 [Nephila pilipes]|uniref:Uncharacterized protein n=1 Tax=Nephila pilipes TaxID=299642 RepID=A0A8X6NCN9_NEPPI|nr:hypothetical protein NPIL_315941 [Nephila pilipes]
MVNFVFTLELLALTKIAIHTYSDTDIKAFQHEKWDILSFESAKQWEPIMKKKLSSLNLPLILEKKVIALMQPLRAEMGQWILDHLSIFKYCTNEPLIEYVWKDNGTIDRLKTAKGFIQCETNNLYLRFQIACVYWLHEEAKQLWGKMPERNKRRFDAIRVDSLSFRWEHAVKDWITFIKSGVDDWRMHPFSHPLLWYCQDRVIMQGNLLQHLFPQDRLNVYKGMMKTHIPTIKKSFCLSKMNAEQFEIMIKKELYKYVKVSATGRCICCCRKCQITFCHFFLKENSFNSWLK